MAGPSSQEVPGAADAPRRPSLRFELPPPEPSRRWRWLVPTIAAAALLVGWLTYLVVRDPYGDEAATAGRTLREPTSVDGLRRLAPVDAAAVRRRLDGLIHGDPELDPGDGSGPFRRVVGSSTIGAYTSPADTTRPTLISITHPLAHDGSLHDYVARHGAANTVRRLVSALDSGAAGVPRSVGTGRQGGSMTCVDGIEDGRTGICVWADRSYVSVVLVADTASGGSAATLTRDLRAAAEH